MKRKLSLCTLVLAISGCMVGPNYETPKVPVPNKYREAPTTQVATTQASTTLPPTDLTRWWTSFNDPTLDRLIQDAVKHNLNLEVARQRVREARAQLGFTGATFWPEIDTTGSATRTRSSQADVTGPGGGPSEHALFKAGFDTTWELDVFGGIRRGIEAAQYAYQAEQWNLRTTLTSLLAELATDYTDLRGTQLQIRIAEENLKAFQETLNLTRAKFNAGIVSDLDVARAEAQVQTTAAAIPSFEARARTDIHAIAVLTGRDPGSLVDQLVPPAALPYSIPPIPVGIPSEILRRRPDIAAAERNLAAATANIGVAVADYYPRFSLTGSFGVESAKVKRLFNSSAAFYNIGPSVSWPIFDAGRIKWNVEIQNARQAQALATYKQTILTALQEVEDSLIQFDRDKLRNSELKQAAAAQQRAVNLAEQLYNKGLSSFLDLLQAQRDLFSVEDQLAASDRALSQDLVAVYKALGGGWENMK